MQRSAGILLSVTSLPSKYGIGCFSREAYKFIDWLKASGQSYWQILPIGPTSYGDSPYQSFSTFAGNPYFISLEEFIENGLLTEDECEAVDFGKNSDFIDYEKLYKNRYPLLRKAYERADLTSNREYESFCKNNSYWLEDYALFMSLKDVFGGNAWNEWDEEIKFRERSAIEHYRQRLSHQIGFHKFIQYEFYRQWYNLKRYANNSGIKIIGDIPIYVAYDSADVWANPELFQLDSSKLPTAVAGCPPDGFSADGQLWGNPLYSWGYHKETGFKWWISRLAHCFDLYDVVRIDHFRGFDEYYSIPYGAATAKKGHWETGPGIELFKAMEKAIGKREVIAEDLGFVTDSVKRLVKESGFPGMKILQFAFDERDTGDSNDYLPHNYDENCVVYTGTHDNQTISSWFETITENERKAARDYLCDKNTPNSKLYKSFISLIMRSKANLCIIPMQDYLGLGDFARMNKPSTVGTNWRWRIDKSDLNADLQRKIYKIAKMYGRV